LADHNALPIENTLAIENNLFRLGALSSFLVDNVAYMGSALLARKLVGFIKDRDRRKLRRWWRLLPLAVTEPVKRHSCARLMAGEE
jgi:hypothetical protein